jgi:pimeloyl-ACP methyl ester carboxylesterase
MVWAFQSHGVPADTFTSDATVRVERVGGSWRFQPLVGVRGAGLVFLPGGMVEARAYGPMARRLAAEGYRTVIVELPMRMARSDEAQQRVADRAREAREAMGPSVPWVLGGHSRGAAIATRLTEWQPAAYRGLALIGTTHPRMDLSGLAVPVVKIGGTRDCVAPRERSEVGAANLPPDTEWRWIEGANHAQFGYYGPQLGDCRAEITRDEQQRQLLESLVALLNRVAIGS